MAVISDGNTYGVPEGLMFSFPLDVNQNGEWSIRKFELNDFQKEKLQKSAEELLEERKIALDNWLNVITQKSFSFIILISDPLLNGGELVLFFVK